MCLYADLLACYLTHTRRMHAQLSRVRDESSRMIEQMYNQGAQFAAASAAASNARGSRRNSHTSPGHSRSASTQSFIVDGGTTPHALLKSAMDTNTLALTRHEMMDLLSYLVMDSLDEDEVADNTKAGQSTRLDVGSMTFHVDHGTGEIRLVNPQNSRDHLVLRAAGGSDAGGVGHELADGGDSRVATAGLSAREMVTYFSLVLSLSLSLSLLSVLY